MSYHIRFLSRAMADVEQAFRWYESQSPGLGKTFIGDTRETVRYILEFPFAASRISPTLHRCLIRRFRYAVIYEVSGDEIVIIRIIHCATKTHQAFTQ